MGEKLMRGRMLGILFVALTHIARKKLGMRADYRYMSIMTGYRSSECR